MNILLKEKIQDNCTKYLGFNRKVINMPAKRFCF